jgi:hypothetical protein
MMMPVDPGLLKQALSELASLRSGMDDPTRFLAQLHAWTLEDGRSALRFRQAREVGPDQECHRTPSLSSLPLSHEAQCELKTIES